eukprot:1439131-Prymnesium_polylepis.2
MARALERWAYSNRPRRSACISRFGRLQFGTAKNSVVGTHRIVLRLESHNVYFALRRCALGLVLLNSE